MAHALQGRRILVGVSGSIAAYKAVLLVRLLVRAGAEVRVLMTPSAATFVAPLTFSTLSRRPVLTSVASEAGWNDHVELGLWADAYVVAPATANTLAQLAHGLCDTIVAAVYLSARCPVLFAPAMDLDMWAHPSTQANVRALQSYGNHLVPVGEGELASGLTGAGRLAEPEDIVRAVAGVLSAGAPLAGRRVLVTAGPTHEAIDPVRFVGNHSSGKMGLALVEALVGAGAHVELVYGPASAKPPVHPRVAVTAVVSARDMHAAATALWPDCDAGILAAAVADYRPADVAREKIKKVDGSGGGGSQAPTLRLVENPDIAAALGASKRDGQVLIGFALETDGERGEAHARAKLARKRLDAIVLNLHRAGASAFGGDDNAATILFAGGEAEARGREPKRVLAKAVVAALVRLRDRASA